MTDLSNINLWTTAGSLAYSTPPAQTHLQPDTQAMLAQLQGNRLESASAAQSLVQEIAGNVQQNTLAIEVLSEQAVCVPAESSLDDVTTDWWFLTLSLAVDSGPGYQHNSGSARGPYLKQLSVAVTPMAPSESAVSTHGSIPYTPVGQTDETDSISGSLSGTIGMFGLDGTGTATGQIGWSHSVSRTIADLGIVNDSAADGRVAWNGTVNLQGNSAHVSGFGVKKDVPTPPAVAVNNFQQDFAWVWFYPTDQRSGDAFTLQADITLVYEYTWTEMVGMQLEATCTQSVPVTIPYPQGPTQST